MKFNKSKCKVLPACSDNPCIEYRLGEHLIESSFVQKDLDESLTDEMLKMSWQCVLAAWKDNHILACIKTGLASKMRKMILPLCCKFLPGVLHVVLSTSEGCGFAGESPDDAHEDDQWAEASFLKKIGWESWSCSAYCRSGFGDALLQPSSNSKRAFKKEKEYLFTKAHRYKTRKNSFKLEEEWFRLAIRKKSLFIGLWGSGTCCPERLWVPHSCKYSR